jgi:hypothetical protein
MQLVYGARIKGCRADRGMPGSKAVFLKAGRMTRSMGRATGCTADSGGHGLTRRAVAGAGRT